MTVYVDDMRMEATVPNGARSVTGRWSHLMADSEAELVAFARQLRMPRAWLQRKRSGVHFDVTDSKRQWAIRLGAVPIECGSDQWRAVVAKAREQYAGGAE